VQICSLCHASSPDTATHCENCQADLSEYSETAQALKRMLANERISLIRISVSQDCCPACRELEGAYPKNEVPRLPIEGCSHPLGCRCHYLPVLEVLFP